MQMLGKCTTSFHKVILDYIDENGFKSFIDSHRKQFINLYFNVY